MNAPDHRYHTLFFDAGGTLITANPSIGRIYADVAGRFDIELDPEQAGLKVRRAFFQMREEEVRAGSPIHTVSEEKAIVWWRELVRRSLDEAVASPRFEEFFQALFAEFALPERYQLFPEARGVLDELRASGHRLGIISNWDYRLRPVLEGLGMAGLFETIVISAEAGCEKPDPRIFEIARTMAGATGGERLFHVGDSRIDDYDGALAGGFDARHLDRRNGDDLRTVLHDLLG